MRSPYIFLMTLLFAVLISCGSGDDAGDNTGDNTSSYGGLYEKCYPNGTCDYGLVCISGFCYESDTGDGDTGGGDTGDGDVGSTCGNNTIETGEVCDGGSKSCSGLQAVYSSGTAQCKSDCTGYDESYCKNRWEIDVRRVKLTEKKPDGDPWDSFGGLPDIFVVIYQNDSKIIHTSVVDDSTSASWSGETATVSLDQSDEYEIEIWDEDVSDHDNVAVLTLENYVVNIFNSGELTEDNYDNLYDKGIESLQININRK